MMLYLMTMVEDEGERRIVDTIYRAHHGAMERAALSILANRQDAEDAVQNAWVQAIRHLDTIGPLPEEERRYYLLAVVKNEALMLLRKRRPTAPLEDWDSTVAGVEENTGYQDIAALFGRLPETYRAALEMKLLLEYSNKEIARHLGISETAAGSRIERGRKLLRQYVEEEGLA